MITVLSRRSLRSEGENYVWTIAAKKEDNFPNEPIRVDFAQHAVAVSGRGKRANSENACGGGELASTARAELRPRRNGDAGSFPGIPVSCTKQIDLRFSGRELGDRSARRERLVVGMSKHTAQSTHGSEPLGEISYAGSRRPAGSEFQ